MVFACQQIIPRTLPVAGNKSKTEHLRYRAPNVHSTEGQPIGSILHNWKFFRYHFLTPKHFIFLCNIARPQYRLEDGETWPVNGATNYQQPVRRSTPFDVLSGEGGLIQVCVAEKVIGRDEGQYIQNILLFSDQGIKWSQVMNATGTTETMEKGVEDRS